jgi:NADH dehydrogenase
VTNVDQNGVTVGDESLKASTVLWAAGVEASPLGKVLNTELDRMGRVVVTPDLSIPNDSSIFIAGDQAHFDHTKNKITLPGVSPVAMQQGRFIAKTILNDIAGKERLTFSYKDKGQMATIGRSQAIVDIGVLKYKGLFAWITWLFVHIYYLTSFKNRLFVVFQWGWSYLTFRRGARLILNKTWKTFRE